MRKFLSLIFALAFTLGMSAKEAVTFDIQVDDTKITVTPSDQSAEYFFYVLNEYWNSMYESYTAYGYTVFELCCNMCEAPYTGTKEFDLKTFAADQSMDLDNLEGTFHGYAGLVEWDDVEGAYLPVGDATYKEIVYGDNEEEEEDVVNGPVFMHFDYSCDSYEFTLDPKEAKQPYYFWVFSEEEKQMLADEYDMTFEDYMDLLIPEYCDESEIFTGAVTNSYEKDWWIDELGKYYVVAAPVKYDEESDTYVAAGPYSIFTFDYTYAPAPSATEVSSIKDLVSYEIEFARAEEVAVSDFGVLAAIYDDKGKAYAIYSTGFYEGENGVTIDGNKATINFKLISEIEEELAPAEVEEVEGEIEAVLSNARKAAPASNGKYRIIIAGKSFVLDGDALYTHAITNDCVVNESEDEGDDEPTATLVESGVATGIYYTFEGVPMDLNEVPVAYEKYSDGSIVLKNFWETGNDLKFHFDEPYEYEGYTYSDVSSIDDVEGFGSSYPYQGYNYYLFDNDVVYNGDTCYDFLLDGYTYYVEEGNELFILYDSELENYFAYFIVEFDYPYASNGKNDVEGINTVLAAGNNKVYDLAGRRVAAPAKGKITIQNGVKVIR